MIYCFIEDTDDSTRGPESNAPISSASLSATRCSEISAELTLSTSSGSSARSKRVCTSKEGSLSSFVIRTSVDKKREIDKQIAKAIFATNSSFRCIENNEVKKALELLRPGYLPPSRKIVSTTLLDEIYVEEQEKCFRNLGGQYVNMSIDGWSNIRNEPIICVTITTEEGRSFLYHTIDTSGHPHTADYLTSITQDIISSCKTKHNCTVSSFVTDNAANMSSMRENIKNDSVVITYGCTAHILNLLSKDFEVKNITEHVVHIVKYFRNNHLASAKYKQAGGKALVLPQEVRWNTLADCIEIYVSEWDKLLKICDENKKEIDSVVFQKVSNIGLKRSAEDFLNILKPISVALDSVQKTNASLSDTVEIWKRLELTFEEELDLSLQQMKVFKNRYTQALTPYHFIAYLLDPTKTVYKLTADEKEQGLTELRNMYSDTGILPLILKVQAQSEPFKKIMFTNEVLTNITPLQWWLSQKEIPDISKNLHIVKQFLCAIASSASVERTFSSFGLVHSKLRNKLGVEKASKLVFLFKYYNQNDI